MSQDKMNRIRNILIISLVVMLTISGLMVLNNFTGFATLNKDISQEIPIEQTFVKNGKIPVEFSDPISAIKINGELIGNVKIYIKIKKDEYVIYQQNDSLGIRDLSEYLSNYNKTNETRIVNVLDYKTDSEWDVDNNGIETSSGVVDFTVKNSEINDLNSENIATLWNVYSIDNREYNTICYGNVQACALAGFNSVSEEWDDTFNLYLGKYGATENNVVSVKLIYLDISFVDSEIIYIESDWQDNRAIFKDIVIELDKECKDTCSLNNIKAGKYKIYIEISNGSILNLTSISFSTEEDKLGFKYESNMRKKDLQITFSSSSLHTFRFDSNIKYRTSRRNFNRNKALTLTLVNYNQQPFYFSTNGEQFVVIWAIDRVVIDLFNETINDTINVTTNVTTNVTVNISQNMTINLTNVTLNVTTNVTQNVTVLSNYTENVSSRVIVGQPVKWVKKAKIVDRRVVLKNIPTNLTVTINNTNISKTDVSIRVDGETKVLDNYEDEKKIKKIDKKIKEEKNEDKKSKLEREKSKIERRVKTRKAVRNLHKIPTITGNFFRSITGNFVLENSTNETALIFDANNEGEEVTIEYFTEAPKAFEENITNGRRVVISSVTHYENILAFAEIPNTPASSIVLDYIVNGSRTRADFDGYDSDGDGLVDYIEWNVPHLSNATYEIIIITKAYHLDKNLEFVSDIYDSVKSRDYVWSDRIKKNEYVRVTFEVNLSSSKDITIYAQSNNNARVEVYEYNSSIKIADFGTISTDSKYKILLRNLTGIQDTFDLKVVDGWVEFDMIIDPLINTTMFNETFTPTLYYNLDWSRQGSDWDSRTNTNCYGGGGDCAHADGNCQEGNDWIITDAGLINLSDAQSAYMSFNYREDTSFDNDEYLRVWCKDIGDTDVQIFETSAALWDINGEWNLGEGTVPSECLIEDARFKVTIQSNNANEDVFIDNFVIIKEHDNITPGLTIESPYNITYPQKPLEFNITGDEDLDYCKFTLDNWASNTTMTEISSTYFSHTNTTMADGAYTARFWCNDSYGNINKTEFVYFSVDAVLPLLTIPTPLNQTYLVTTIEFNISTNENMSTCKFSIDNWTTNYSMTRESDTYFNYTLGSITDGTYTARFICNDSAGNDNITQETFSIDTTLPSLTIVSPLNLTLNTTTIDFNISTNENISECVYSIDDWVTNISMTRKNDTYFNYTYTVLGLESKTVNFWCNDTVNHSNTTSVSYSYKDIYPPEITLYTLGNGNYTNYDSVYFTFNVTDLTTLNNCSLYYRDIKIDTNSSVNKNYTQVFLQSGMADGNYSWRGECTDFSNNTGASVNWTFVLDNTVPTVTLNKPEDGWWFSTNTVQMNYTPNDPGASNHLEECQLWGNFSGTWELNQTYYSPISLNVNPFDMIHINEGEYIWNVICNDSANNSGWATNNFTFYVDVTYPSLNFTSPTPKNDTNQSSTTMIINVTHTDIGKDAVRLYINGVLNQTKYPVQNYTNFTVINIKDGVYLYYTWINDSAGNSNISVTRTITKDSTSPSIALDIPTNDSWVNTNNPLFSYIVTDNIIGVENCSLIINDGVNKSNITITEGVKQNITSGISNSMGYNWSINCTDHLGNENMSEIRLIKVDTTYPQIDNESIDGLSFNINDYICLNATVRDTFSDTNTVYAEVYYPISGLINVSLSNESGCGNAGGDVWSYSLQLAENGEFNWTRTHAIDKAGNINTTSTTGIKNWSVISTIFLDSSIQTPLVDFVLNESLEINYSYTQSCSVNCSSNSPATCDDVTIYADYYNVTWNSITTETSTYVNSLDNYSCGNLTAPMWWNSQWKKRKQINITNVGTTQLENFPVYINLSYESTMIANYSDLRFIGGACGLGGTTELSYEVENYTATNAHIWLRIPTLSTGINKICVYYNNSAVNSGENKTDVWNNDYVMVHHMSDNTTSQVIDSTKNDYNGDKLAVNEPNQISDGIVGHGQEFDGIDDHITFSAPNDGGRTVSIWFRNDNEVTGEGDKNNLLTYAGNSIQNTITTGGASSYATSETLTMLDQTGNYRRTYIRDTITVGWHHVVFVWDGSRYHIWLDGKEPTNYAGTAGHIDRIMAFSVFELGKDYADEFDGIMDEIRLSNVTRSDDWINQSYRMIVEQDTLVKFNSEEDYTPVNDSCNATFTITSGTSSGGNIWPIRCSASSTNAPNAYSSKINITVNDYPDANLVSPLNNSWIKEIVTLNGSTTTDDFNISQYVFEIDDNTGFTSSTILCDSLNTKLEPNAINSTLTGTYPLYAGNETNTTSDDDSYLYIGSSGASDVNGYVMLYFNFTENGVNTELLTGLSFDITYCHSGNDYPTSKVVCDGTPASGVVNGNQDVEAYNFTEERWIDIGDLRTNDNGNQISDRYQLSMNFSDFINETSGLMIVRYEMNYSNSFAEDKSFLVIDYAILNISYDTKLDYCMLDTLNQNQCLEESSSCYIRLNVTDNYGLKNSVTINVKIDNIGPNTIMVSPTNYTNITQDSYLVSASAIDGGSGIDVVTFMYRINDTSAWTDTCSAASPAPYNCSWDLSSLSDGTKYEVKSYANDSIGNVGDNYTVLNITIERKGPSIALETPLNDTWSLNDVAFIYNVTDEYSVVPNCSLLINKEINQTNLTIIQDTKLNFSLIEMADGEYNWSVRCFDQLGNQNTTNERRLFIDNTAPVITIIDPTNYSNVSGVYLFNSSIVERGIGVNVSWFYYRQNESTSWVTICNDTVSPFTCNWNTTQLDEVTTYELKVAANDSLGLIGINYTVQNITVDNTGPSISLKGPANNTQYTYGDLTFNYTVNDVLLGIYNCSLHINGTLNTTNTTITQGATQIFSVNDFGNGNYTWNVNCSDDRGNTNVSEYRKVIVAPDTKGPNVTLQSPANESTYSTLTVVLEYYVDDVFSGIENCSLFFNNTYNQTNTTIIKGATNSFTVYAYEANYTWNVSCIDDSPAENIGYSGEFNFSLIEVTAININVTANDTFYERGEVAYITTNTTDTFGNYLETNVKTDLIFGNTTTPWWDTAWGRRKPILINSNNNTDRTNITVLVNVTGLNGNISNCVNEIRVISTSREERTVNVLSGDDSDYCYIAFVANVGASAINESIYYVYFDNPGASSPGYNTIPTTNYPIHFTGFEADSSSPWDGWSDGGGDVARVNDVADLCSDSSCPGTGSWSVYVRDNGAGRETSQDFNMVNRCGGADCENMTFQLQIMPYSYDNSNEGFDIWCDYGTGSAFELADWKDQGNNCDTIGGILVCELSWHEVRFDLGSCTLDTATELRITAEDSSSGGNGDLSYFDGLNLTGQLFEAPNITATFVGQTEEWLVRNRSESSGLITWGWDTWNKNFGNYSAVSLASNNDYDNNSDYDWFEIITDITDPWITLNIPENGTWNQSTSIRLNYTPSDNSHHISLCKLRFNGTQTQTNNTITDLVPNYFRVTDLGEGLYNWSINCTDTTSNEGNSTTNYFTLDVTDPNIVLNWPSHWGNSSTDDVNFNFTATDNLDSNLTCNLTVDAIVKTEAMGAISGEDTNEIVTGLSDGVHTWKVTCWDDALNTKLSSQYSFTVDTTYPIVTLNTPTTGTWDNDGTVQMQYLPVDTNLVKCELWGNFSGTWELNQTHDSPNSGVSNTFSSIKIADGYYKWNVNCSDGSGNMNYSVNNYTLFIDTTNPGINYSNTNPVNYYNQSLTTVVVNVTHSEYNPDTIKFYWNGTLNETRYYSGTYSNFTVDGLSDGVYRYYVWVNDSAGNTNQTQTYYITIDTTPPSLYLVYPVNDSWIGNTLNPAAFKYNVSDSLLTVENCTLYINSTYNQTNITITENQIINFSQELVEGVLNWSISCEDDMRNKNDSEVRMLKADLTYPSVSIQQINDTNLTVNRYICLNATVSDAYSGIGSVYAQIIDPDLITNNVYLYDNETTSCDDTNDDGVYSAVWQVTVEGSYNWSRTYAIDNAGNTNYSVADIEINASSLYIMYSYLNLPTGILKINETVGSFVMNCSAECGASSETCENVAIRASFNESGSSYITTLTTNLTNSVNGYVCGDLAASESCNYNFTITAGATAGNNKWNVWCSAISDTAGTVKSTDELNLTVNDAPYGLWTYPSGGSWLTSTETLNASSSYDNDGTIVNYAFEIDNNTGFGSSSTICSSGNDYCAFDTTSQIQCNEETMACYLRITVIDNDGHTNSTIVNIGIDNVGPNSTIVQPANYTNITSNTYVMNTSVIDIGSGIDDVSFIYSTDGNSWLSACDDTDESAPYNCSWNLAALSDGNTYYIRSYANDSENNIGQNYSIQNVVVDRNGPLATLISPNNDTWSQNNMTFRYTANDLYSGMRNCSLLFNDVVNLTNTTVLEGETMNFTVNNVPDGYYNWSVACADSQRNQNTSLKNLLKIDNTGPLVAFVSPINFTNISGAYQVNATATDSGIGVNNTKYFYRQNGTGSWTQICQVNSSPYECGFSTSGFPETRTYEFMVVGNDTLGNVGSNYINLNITIDNTKPDLTLIGPANNSQDVDGNIEFSYQTEDSLSDIRNCTLYINDSYYDYDFTVSEGESQTLQASGLGNKNYTWYIACSDSAGNTNNSEIRNISVTPDTYPPVISLVSPADNSTYTNTDVVFRYNVTDAVSDILNCSLMINGTLNQTNATAIVEGAINTFTLNGMSDGNYSWNITCSDSSIAKNTVVSVTWNYSLIETAALDVNVTSDKYQYQDGEIGYFETNVTDVFTSLILSNITTDIIKGNGTTHWWNTSWKMRKPIMISTNNETDRYNLTIWINITGLTNNISNCQEIRIISTSNEEMTLNILNGDGSTYCEAVFLADVGANVINETKYHAYYDNAGIGDPGYSTISVSKYSIQFTGYETGWDSWSDGGADALRSNTINYCSDASCPGGGSWSIEVQDNTAESYTAQTFDFSKSCGGDACDDISFSVYLNPLSYDLGEGFDIWCDYGGGSAYELADWKEPGSGCDSIGGASVCEGTWTKSSYNISDCTIDSSTELRITSQDSGAGADDDQVYIDGINITGNRYLAPNITESNVGDAEIWIERNTSESSSWTFGWDSFNLTYGTYSAVSYASSSNYNDGSNFTWFEIIADTTIPGITLNSPDNSSYKNSTSVNVYYTPSDNSRHFTSCKLAIDDSIEQTDTTISDAVQNYFQATGLSEGLHNWSVNCTDYRNNENKSELSWFYVDLTKPSIQLETPIHEYGSSSNEINFNFTVTDNMFGGNLSCNLTIDDFVNNTNYIMIRNGTYTNYTVTNIPNGLHTWNIICMDNATNKNTSLTRNLTIDTSPPSITLDAPVNGSWDDDGLVQMSYTPTDNYLDECQLWGNFSGSWLINLTNSSPANADTNTFATRTLDDGRYVWNVNCSDTSGNRNWATNNYTIFVDTTLPTISYSTGTPGNNTYHNRDYIFVNVTASDDNEANITFTLYNSSGLINETVLGAGNRSINFTALDNNSIYYYNVTIRDYANNKLSTQRYMITLDNINPTVSLDVPENETVYGSVNLLLKYTATDTNLFSCIIYHNDTGWDSNVTNSSVLSGVQDTVNLSFAEGSKIWNVWCNDSAGNVGWNETNLTFSIDITSPSIVFDSSNPVNYYNQTSTTFVINVTHTEWHPDRISLYWNNSLNESKSYSGSWTNFTVSGLVNGPYTYYVWINDSVGNVNLTETRTVTVDYLPPTIALNWPLNNTWHDDDIEIFNYTASDNTVGIANCSLIIDNQVNSTNFTVTEGIAQFFNISLTSSIGNSWRINCTDKLGNINSSEIRIIKIDKTYPVISGETINNSYMEINSYICLNVTVSDTFSNTSSVKVAIDYPVSGETNVTLSNSSGCGNYGENIWSYSLLVNEVGAYNWTRTYATDNAGNVNITSPSVLTNWSSYSNNFLNSSMIEPTTNLRYNVTTPVKTYNFTLNCNTTCRPDSTQDCQSVTLFADYFDSSWNAINTSSPKLINNVNNATCGLVLKGDSCNSTFKINITSDAGGEMLKIRCRGTSSNSAVGYSPEINLTVNQFPSATFKYPTNDSWLYSTEILNGSFSTDDRGFSNYKFEIDNNIAFGSSSVICSTGDRNCSFNTLSQTQCANESLTCFLRLNVTDIDGLTNTTYITIGIDNTGPTTTLDFPANYTNMSSNSYMLNATISDVAIGPNTTIFLYRQNESDTWKSACMDVDFPYNCSWNITSLDDGDSYQIRVYGNDSYGNTGENDTHYNITIDKSGPSISLSTPVNNTRSYDGHEVFKYSVTDIYATVASCSLIINDEVNQTNTSITEGTTHNFSINDMQNGQYNWSVNCTDSLGNENGSIIYNLTVEMDSVAPNVTLLEPVNGSTYSSEDVLFQYYVNDIDSGITNCSLFINDVFNRTNVTGVIENQINTFLVPSMVNGNYTWRVECSDDNWYNKNLGVSHTYNLTLLIATAILMNTTSDKTVYEVGEIALFNTTTKDQYNNILNSTITVSIINESTVVPWLDSQLRYRKNINITIISGDQIPLNYTLNYTLDTATLVGAGKMQADGDDLRIGYWNNDTGELIELDRFLEDMNSASTHVYFRSRRNISNASPELTYYIYYGNSTVSNPPTDKSNIYLHYDSFDSDSLSTYTKAKSFDDANKDADSKVTYDGANDWIDYSGTPANGSSIRRTIPEARNVIIEVDQYVDAMLGNPAHSKLGVAARMDGETYYHFYASTNIINSEIGRYNSASETSLDTSGTKYTSNDVWHRLKFLVYDNNTHVFLRAYVDGSILFSYNDTSGSRILNAGGFSVGAYQLDGFWDNLTVKLYYDSTVTYNTDIEEYLSGYTTGYTGISGILNSNVDTFTIDTGNFSVVSFASKNGFINGSSNTSIELVTFTELPSISLNQPQDNFNTQTLSLMFNYTPGDNSNHFRNCSILINDIFNATNSSGINDNQINNFTISNFVEGLYNWSVECYDASGAYNISGVNDFTIDITPPSITIVTPLNTSYSLGSIDFNISSNENLSICLVTTDNWATNNTMTAVNTTHFNYTLTSPSEGSFTARFWCNDTSGNVNNTEWVSYTVTSSSIDLTTVHPINITYKQSYMDFNITTTTSASVCIATLDNWVTNHSMTRITDLYYKYTNSSMADGNYKAQFWCNNTFGNGYNTSEVSFKIDTTSPEVSIISPINTTYNGINVDFNITADENISTCIVSIDNWVTNTTMTRVNDTYWSYNNPNMNEESYTAKFWCNDTIGNINGTEQYSFKINIPETDQFAIKNPIDENTAIFDVEGDLYLRNTYLQNQVFIAPPPNSFVIQNSTGHFVAYINSTGHLMLRGTLSVTASMLTTGSNLEIRNSTDDLVAFFDSKGNLKLLGYAYENYTG